MTSRLSSSAHWRSSNTSRVGRSSAALTRSAISSTIARREPQGVGPLGPADSQERLAEARDVLVAAHRARHVPDRRERHLRVGGREVAAEGVEPGGPRLALDRAAEPGLADAGLALEQQQRAVPGVGIGEQPVGELEEVIATDEEGAQDLADGHDRDYTAALGPVIGRTADVGHALAGPPRRARIAAIDRRKPLASPDTIRTAPKALLHDHLDGGLRPATIVDLAREYGYRDLPTEDVDDLAALVPARRGPQEPGALPRDVRPHGRRHAASRRDRPRRRRVRGGPGGRRRRVRRGPVRARALDGRRAHAGRGRARGARGVPDRGASAPPPPATRSSSGRWSRRCARPPARWRSRSSR